MGRHRRSAAGRAATGRATGDDRTQPSGTGSGDDRHPSAGRRPVPMGIAPYLNPEAYAEATARAQAYLYSTDDGSAPAAPEYDPTPSTSAFPSGHPLGGSTPPGGPSHGRRRGKKAARPVRAGLLGVSAAVALGTVAVATGVMPGLEHYQLGGGTHTTGGEQVQAVGTPSNTASEQGGTSGTAESRDGGTAHRGTGHTPSPIPSASASTPASASASPSKPAASRTPAPSEPAASQTPAPSKTAARKPAPRTTPKATPSTSAEPSGTPSHKVTEAPTPASPPVTVSTEAAAAAQVLKLVNDERAKAGCSPLSANSSLTSLAGVFSDDMAARGFFDHTDPDGRTPGDRAARAGITDLGGENIARGQTDAAAVVRAWMDSPGHRANILNPDFKTLGVGVHFGPGGPWWTQDFGY
ncbi:CAP domain-containing protein [Streptomyces dangxiongensis]|uniref:CAP domain-containing protein n=1 Tax=Streptomyces dangxiongensis TaxID=1442032 RepID=A0A3G2JMC5_9ACTN|nr:CAP domain-containing protein [Streptomyces dangxiongensis]AYN43586.1 CAP domain-containing protein [Streptomyces dangxiongensis]